MNGKITLLDKPDHYFVEINKIIYFQFLCIINLYMEFHKNFV